MNSLPSISSFDNTDESTIPFQQRPKLRGEALQAVYGVEVPIEPTETAFINRQLLDLPYDDAGNAEAVALLYGDVIRFTDERGWMTWTGKKWEASRHAVIKLVEDTLRARKALAIRCRNRELEAVSNCHHATVSNALKSLEHRVLAKLGDFDQNDRLIPVLNGVYDIVKGELLEHDPQYMFTWHCPYPYDEKADYTILEQFLDDALAGGHEDTRALQRAAGYSATGSTREDKFFYPYGPGRAGKGTFLSYVTGVLGEVAARRSMSSFTARKAEDTNRFDMAGLVGKRMVYAEESNRHDSLNEAFIKDITGGSQISAAFKGRDLFQFQPRFKLWMVSNFALKANSDDSALWARAIIFHFPNSHIDDADTSIRERGNDPDFMTGVTRWMLEGAHLWYTSGLIVTETSREQGRIARARQDNVTGFIEDHLTLDRQAFIPSKKLSDIYRLWCEDNNVEPKKHRSLLDALEIRIPGFKEHRQREGATLTRGYLGARVQVTAENVDRGY